MLLLLLRDLRLCLRKLGLLRLALPRDRLLRERGCKLRVVGRVQVARYCESSPLSSLHNY